MTNRFDRGVSQGGQPDASGASTQSPAAPDRGLVSEGPLVAERQALMDVVRKALKPTGYGHLSWQNTTVLVPSEPNMRGSLTEMTVSYSDENSKLFRRFGQMTHRLGHKEFYDLFVRLEGQDVDTDNLSLELTTYKKGRDSNLFLVVSSSGEVLQAKGWERTPEIWHREIPNPDPSSLASLMDDATAFLNDALTSPVWQNKPMGPVHSLPDVTFEG